MPKIGIFICPSQMEQTAWNSFLGNGPWDLRQIGPDGHWAANYDELENNSVTHVVIVGHGGFQDSFLDLNGGVAVATVGQRIKTALTGKCSGNCTFRVQICNAGVYPNPPFIEMVTPAGITATSPTNLSYIDRTALRRVDMRNIEGFNANHLATLRILMTRNRFQNGVVNVFRRVFPKNRLLNMRDDYLEHENLKVRAFFTAIAENAAPSLELFGPISNFQKLALLEVLWGGSTTTHRGT